jgi:transcriptional regulator with XRE-family HTH domain
LRENISRTYNMSTKKRKNIQYIEVGNRIKSLRKSFPGPEKKSMIQDEFSKLLGIGKRTLVNYEKGHSDVSGTFLINIARLCNISIDWILTGQTSKAIGENESRDLSASEELEVLKSALSRSGKLKGIVISEIGEQSTKNLLKILQNVDMVRRPKKTSTDEEALTMSEKDEFIAYKNKEIADLKAEIKELKKREKLKGVR